MQTSKDLNMYFGMIAGMIALLIIATGSVIIFIRYQKKILLQQQALHNNALTYQQNLLISNVQSVEEERKRIAKDVHDELGGIFSILSLTINQFHADEEHNKKIIASSEKLIDTGIKSVRRIAHVLMPHELELFGLHNALESFLCDTGRSTGIDIGYANTIGTIAVKPDTELALYRIIQELISNTIKHAAASAIEINFSIQDEKIMVCYQDNGNGMPQSNKAVSGMGLKNIESRIIVLQGTAEFISLPEQGYCCRLQVPLSQNIIV